MKKQLIIFFFIILIGCNEGEVYKTKSDSLQIANAKIGSNIEGLKYKITVENNRLDRERQQKEQREREIRISNLKSGINGTYFVGNKTCSISNGKITWSSGKSYDKLIYMGDVFGNKSYYEYDNYEYKVGEFLFYQDYSKGTYLRRDGVTFDVTKNLY
jgi:hypothetical protein